MNESKMKNMIVLKDIPSNIVEEAYVILKPNLKYKKYIEKETKNKKNTSPDYVLKEAEMVVSNYLSNIEKDKKIRNIDIEKVEKKCKKLKKLCIILGAIVVLNFIVNLIK